MDDNIFQSYSEKKGSGCKGANFKADTLSEVRRPNYNFDIYFEILLGTKLNQPREKFLVSPG